MYVVIIIFVWSGGLALHSLVSRRVAVSLASSVPLCCSLAKKTPAICSSKSFVRSLAFSTSSRGAIRTTPDEPAHRERYIIYIYIYIYIHTRDT